MVIGDGADLAQGKEYFCPFYNGRGSLFIQDGYKGLAGFKFHDGIGGLERRVGTEGVCCSLDGFLVLGSEGAQCVLDAVAELAKDVLRDIGRALRYKVNTNAFASDEPDNLLNLVYHRLGSIVKEHVGLVKEEYQFGTVHVSHFRKGAVEF